LHYFLDNVCCFADWFQPWPENALFDVAKRFLNDVDLGAPATKDAITKFMPFSFAAVNKASEEYLHQEKRYNYTTPKSFLELIYMYKNMLATKMGASDRCRWRFSCNSVSLRLFNTCGKEGCGIWRCWCRREIKG
jgi:dynein heavy chain